MGLKECEIQFDNSNGVYYAGQTVSGNFILTLDTVKKVRGVYIKFKGEAQTKWSIEESHTNNQDMLENERVDLTGQEQYFSTQFYLVGSTSGEVEIPPGEHIYPFTCLLPPTLPSSFEGQFGYIRYTVRVVLDRPWKFDQDVKAAFTVLSPVDLNYNKDLKEPVTVTLEKYFCCLCCRSGPLTCVISLPGRGYVPGQTVPILAEVDNISNVDIVGITFSFNKVVRYYSQTPRRDVKKNEMILQSISVGPVKAHESRTYHQPILVPPLPPSNLENCNLIDLEYDLKIEAKVDGFHQNLIANIPLTIGTVPFNAVNGDNNPSAPLESKDVIINTGPNFGSYGWANPNPGGDYVPMPTAGEFGTTNIRDSEDNDYTKINDLAYKPLYPVWDFGKKS